MLRYLFQRFVAMIPTVIGVTILVFIAIRLIPGDAITASLGTEAGMLTETQRQSLEAYFGLDKPPVEQYFSWITNVVQGDLGYSVRRGEAVLDLILRHFPVTLELALMSVTIGATFGISIGILSALYNNTLVDVLARLLALIGLAMPSFLVATLMIYTLSVYFGVLPNAGNYVEFTEDPVRNIQQIILPAFTLGFALSASIMRMTRSSLLEVLGEDYVRTAYSKGLRKRTVIAKHSLRNTLIPVVTLIGIELGYLLGGAVIVEEIFALPGLGRLAVTAINQRDYALIQGVTLFIALLFVLINLLVDLIYAMLDPRISYASD